MHVRPSPCAQALPDVFFHVFVILVNFCHCLPSAKILKQIDIPSSTSLPFQLKNVGMPPTSFCPSVPVVVFCWCFERSTAPVAASRLRFARISRLMPAGLPAHTSVSTQPMPSPLCFEFLSKNLHLLSRLLQTKGSSSAKKVWLTSNPQV